MADTATAPADVAALVAAVGELVAELRAARLADVPPAAPTPAAGPALLLDRRQAAARLGYGSAKTFARDVQALRDKGFPQPVPKPGHPRWRAADLDAWANRSGGFAPRRKPRRAG